MENYICGGNKYIYKGGYVALPVEVKDLPNTISVQGNELLLKSSFHVSLVCVKRLIEPYGEAAADIEQKILELFCAFVSKNAISFLTYKNEFRFAVFEERKSAIVLCEVSNLDKFPQLLKSELGIEIPVQPTHVTLYTLEPDAGIGLNSQAEMEVKSRPVAVPETLKKGLGII